MKVKLSQAVKMFFSSSSLEMVFLEAVANSLEARATQITIDIELKAFGQPETLTVKITDNGEGFTDARYAKFSKLFDVDDGKHKGLGRLVYLCYFEKVHVESFYEGTKCRRFAFDEQFEEDAANVTKVPPRNSGTTLSMSGYPLSKIAKQDYVNPVTLKSRLLHEFYPLLNKAKEQKKEVTITIRSVIENHESVKELQSSELPDLISIPVDSPVDLFDKLTLSYSIQEVDPSDTSLISAIAVDNRSKPLEIIAKENHPIGYDMVFLLVSDWFNGKVDFSRQNLDLSDSELKEIEQLFRREVAKIIEEKLPEIKERNKATKQSIIDNYPHLIGYMKDADVGYTSRRDVLKKAQEGFFRDQRELLDAGSLTEEQYDKAMDMSARALTEYILFRQLTIDKLQKTSAADREEVLHNYISRMGTTFDGADSAKELYHNNVWLLDDKYMTYETVFSNQEMGELVKKITDGEDGERDNDLPDIALVFSRAPDAGVPFDVVIVELKRRGLTLEENMKVVTQLEKRARKLMKYYNNRIQRIWYYGIVDIDDELELHLRGEYQELYSVGKMFHKPVNVAIQKDPLLVVQIGVFIWDIDAVVSDAEARNKAFLNLIKNKLTEE